MDNKILKFKFYSDPGHGWLAVKLALLHKLEIADAITHYSYVKGKTVYLEEDSDVTTLFTTLKARNIEYQVVHSKNRSLEQH